MERRRSKAEGATYRGPPFSGPAFPLLFFFGPSFSGPPFSVNPQIHPSLIAVKFADYVVETILMTCALWAKPLDSPSYHDASNGHS